MRYADTIIQANSHAQKSISLSSIEAKYVALSDAVKTVTWLAQLLGVLGVRKSLTIMFQNNTDAIEWENAVLAKYFSRTKHVDFRHNYDVSLIEGGQIVLKQISTKQMLADFLTTPLGLTAFTSAIEEAKMIGAAHKMAKN